MNPMPRSLFISHGGGPLPLLGDPAHRELVACLKDVAAGIPKPDAILVVSAHWEASSPTLTAAARPSLIYDYYGFPPESYEIGYPCAGEPALAEAVCGMLDDAGFDAKLDESGAPCRSCPGRTFWFSGPVFRFITCPRFSIRAPKSTTNTMRRLKAGCRPPAKQKACRRPSDAACLFTGLKRPVPDTATRGKSICCRFTFVTAWPSRLASNGMRSR